MDTLLSYLLRFAVGGGVYVDAAMAANYTVNLTIGTMSPHFYNLAPASADRQFILPDPAATLIGVPFLVSNSAAGGGYNVLVRGKTLTYTGTLSSASTIGTIPPGVTAYAICYDDGTYFRWKYQALSSADALTLTGALTAGGIINNSTLDQNGNIDQDTTQTGSGAGLDTLTQASSATGSPSAVEVGLTQITNNRTAGIATGVDVTITGRAGDTSGGTYEAFGGAFTGNGGSAVSIFARVSAGFSRLLDLTGIATTEAVIALKDNLADALSLKVGSTFFAKVITTTSAYSLALLQQVTTTDGVASGLTRKIGGTASVAVTTSSAGPSLGTAEQTIGTITIPASTIKAGTLAQWFASARCSAETGATTCTFRVKLGGTTLFTSAAVDLALNDVFNFQLAIVGRAAPGAAAAVAVAGGLQGVAGGSDITKAISLAVANYATNGALDLVLTAQLSASDANAVDCVINNLELQG